MRYTYINSFITWLIAISMITTQVYGQLIMNYYSQYVIKISDIVIIQW